MASNRVGPDLVVISADPRITSLYENAKRAQWNGETDLEWKVDVAFGAPLPEGSYFAISAFNDSSIASGGRELWDAFRWEFQSWMVSQFLHGEQGAMIAAARLVESLPDLDAKLCAATQVVDEARHVEVFSRYVRENLPQPYPNNKNLSSLLLDVLSDSRWDIVALGIQIVIEAVAMAAFRLADHSFHDELIRRICRLVGRDETRHVSLGVLSLGGLYGGLTSQERADREDLVLEAASAIRNQFLLEEIWERLAVSRAAGAEFAATSELMIQYRQAIFARVIASLTKIGLMSDRMTEGMRKLGLAGSGTVAGRPMASGRRVL